jgi:riboflavin synthase
VVKVFTGLVAELGRVERLDAGDEGARIRIATQLAAEISSGDSVAVSGVCLTAAEVAGAAFEADVANQTLRMSSLGGLQVGDSVNLELALRPSDRMGGHIVQGHVDGTGEIAAVQEDGISRLLTVSIPAEMRRYVVERGSVTVDGVSLTVAETSAEGFEVALIPETLQRTTLGERVPGSRVNVELDVIARYVEGLMSGFRD